PYCRRRGAGPETHCRTAAGAGPRPAGDIIRPPRQVSRDPFEAKLRRAAEGSMNRQKCLRWLAAALVGLPLGAQPVPLHAQRGAPQNGEWRTYGGDPGNSKYSPLDQITRDNFTRLKVAWRWKSVDGFLSKTIPGGGEVWGSSNVIFDQLNRENPKRWRDGQA